ncbi:tetratricopeptide repeat protein [Alienimonas californiensis]|uniref:Tetratricopeptide repeat protein n=1 Tax=Alienimonas californiensis TaxID=2527989 RepID=A0A517PDB4_9PLAN|nr:tetratricopeptide repeat protein [Alienimonas californiensis]QDT17363.1 tetratricopeptide repeat protein [Alienimonas californiensis]
MSAPPATDLSAVARAHAAAGQREEAADAYEQAAAAAPMDVELHMAAGGAVFAAGRLDRAIELFEKVTRLTPAHARALVNIGAIHNRTGDHKQAERVLQKAISLDHNIAEGFYNLGIARRKLNRNKLAAEAYREAVRLDPAFAEAHQNLGNTLLDLGRARAAADAFREALRIRPDFPKASAGLRRAEAEAEKKQASLTSLDRFALPPAPGGPTMKTAVRQRRYPVLSANHRMKDRAQLGHLTVAVEASAAGWAEILKGDLPAALGKLEHAIAGSTGTTLVDAFDTFERAVERADGAAAAYRIEAVRTRAHEELIRAPKLPDLDPAEAGHEGAAEPPSSASSPAIITGAASPPGPSGETASPPASPPASP